MRELRHDFRFYYHVGYDEVVEVDEALDLALTLPPGSLFVARMHPERAWSEQRELACDIQDHMTALAFAMRGRDGAPRMTRPADIVATRRAQARAAEARRKMKETEWTEEEGE